MTIPRATYRLQFHDGFTFADAEAIVPYLDRLGISHVYTSPITRAAAGSTHGYDVVDPTVVGPNLGGEDGFRSLVIALRARGMGVVIDIVPNHMGVAIGENAWWEDVLLHGEASPYARFFDIDWSRRIVLPVLGASLANALASGDLTLDEQDGRWSVLVYGEKRFPVRDEDQAGLPTDADLAALLDRQHYRLAHWRVANDELNWRRFFTVNELAGLRVEDPAVFEETHVLYLRLYREGLIDGVRVDHVDGLTDTVGYCRTLRARLDAIRPGAYLVVEKILAHGEPLATDWGIDGTSGYDFMEEISSLLHDPAGRVPLEAEWARVSGRSPVFEPEETLARQQVLAWAFDGQLEACVAAFKALADTAPDAGGVTAGMLRRAIERLLWVFPVYRTYGTGDAAPADDALVRDTARNRAAAFTPPGEAPIVDLVLGWLSGKGGGDLALAKEAVRRFQQLSAPIAAKAVEDTAFYRYGRLLSRNNVGFDPTLFATPIGEFHAAMALRAERFPHEMLATATHDHKRGEDVRSRLCVLSGIPDRWVEQAREWRALGGAAVEGVDGGDLYMLFQTMFSAWPEGLGPEDAAGLSAYADRLTAWQQKALREAKLRSSWEQPDEAYEAACADAIRALLDPARSPGLVEAVAAFVRATGPAADANSLVQAGLHLLVPGMPDTYQGTEIVDFTLVDPDNRRPVDYPERERRLEAGGDAKLDLIHELLDLRRAEPDLFAHGDYRPLSVAGPRADRVVAFERSYAGRALRVVVAVRCAEPLVDGDARAPSAEWWGETRLEDGTRVADALGGAAVAWNIG